jgi:hypothetical protein
MPTSLKTLMRYRTAHTDEPESRRVWLFHSHTYFDHTVPACVAEARAFRDLIRQTFAARYLRDETASRYGPRRPRPAKLDDYKQSGDRSPGLVEDSWRPHCSPSD